MKKLIALLLAMMMVMSLCACGGSDDAEETEEDAAVEETVADEAEAEAEVAAADAEAPAETEELPDDVDASASGEASADAADMDVEFYEPTSAYSKDFEGYRQYCIDGFLADQFHPDELEESTVEEFENMTEDDYESGDRYTSLTDLGVLLTYEEFLAY